MWGQWMRAWSISFTIDLMTILNLFRAVHFGLGGLKSMQLAMLWSNPFCELSLASDYSNCQMEQFYYQSNNSGF
jgi:hypothetical protein